MTKATKSFHGWICETNVPLDGKHTLHFSTMKRSNGTLATNVTRLEIENGGFSFVVFHDYSANVLTERLARVTAAAVEAQHAAALAKLDDIKAACEAHYAVAA